MAASSQETGIVAGMNTFNRRTAIRIAAVSLLLAAVASPIAWFVARENAEEATVSLAMEESRRLLRHFDAVALNGPKAGEKAAKAARTIAGCRGFFMIRSTDSELASAGCCSLGTTGEVCTNRGLTCSDSLSWPETPRLVETATSQTVPARTFHAHMHRGGSHFPRGTDHSKPIGRTVVERFSPIRF